MTGTQCLHKNKNLLMQMGLGPLDHDGRHWVHCRPYWFPAVHRYWHFRRHQVQHRQVQSTGKVVWPAFLHVNSTFMTCLQAASFLASTTRHAPCSCTLYCQDTPGTTASCCAPMLSCCSFVRCKGCKLCAIQVADSTCRPIHCLAVQCDIQHSPGVLVHLGGCQRCS